MTLNTNDAIAKQEVELLLNVSCSNLTVEVVELTDSTNDDVRMRAKEGAAEGFVMIAGAQTKGRGRRGHAFFSPEGAGVYLSMLLRPQNATANRATNLTTMAAVAACEAIEAVSSRKAQIKWVNDVFIEGRKAAGILTEASVNAKTGAMDYAVLGIGFNAYEPQGGYPEDLGQIAGAVFQAPQKCGRNRLAAEFLNRFMTYYKACENCEHAEEEGVVNGAPVNLLAKYRERCFVIGRDVFVISESSTREARALDVDDAYRLVVQYSDGFTEALSSGEISVRPICLSHMSKESQ